MAAPISPRRRLLSLAVVGAALVFWGVGSTACSAPEVGIPVYTVEEREFQHKVSADGQLQAVKTTQLMVPQQANTGVRLAWLAPEGSTLKAGEVVARFDGKSMHEELEDKKGDLQSNRLELEKAEINSQSTLDGLKKNLEVAEIELQHAEEFQKTNSQVFSRKTIQEDALDAELARERKHHAESSADTRRSLAKTEEELLNIRRQQVQMEIERVSQVLEALEIVAPHDGVLTLTTGYRGAKPGIGMQMWSGQPIGEIPDLTEMEARVYVLEADAGGLTEGVRAEVVVEAHPEKVYPATIKSVEAVAQPRFAESPVQYFGVVLSFEATDPAVMKPGGRVTATLFLEHREQAVVVPRQSVFQLSAGNHNDNPPSDRQNADGESGQGAGTSARVYVRRGKDFEPREVRVGPTSVGSVVIESGLSPGEVVALSEPWTQGGQEAAQSTGPGTLGSMP